MSTDDMITYSDPDMPGMAFGRPPTRPSRPAATSEVVDDHDPGLDQHPDPDSDPDVAPADRRDERLVEAGSAEVDGRDERTVDVGLAEPDGTNERAVEPGPDAADDVASEPEPASPTSADDDGVAPPEPDADEVDEPDAGTMAGGPVGEPYLSPVQIADLHRRWGAVQAGFVDDPRRAVEVADDIVGEAVGALQAAIDDRRRELAEPWRDHADASTDALLVAFQSYRSVFERVLSS